MTDAAVDPITAAAGPSLARRRALVVAVSVVVVALAVAAWVGSPVATLTASAAFIGGYLLLRKAIDDVADKPDGDLDERLVGLRNTAYLHAYRIFAAATGLALLVLFIAADSSRLDVTPDHIQALFLTALATSTALPSMILAWREREV